MPSNARRPSLSTYLQVSITEKEKKMGRAREKAVKKGYILFPPLPKSAMLNAQNRRARKSKKPV
jgi:hypothetical protein